MSEQLNNQHAIYKPLQYVIGRVYRIRIVKDSCDYWLNHVHSMFVISLEIIRMHKKKAVVTIA